MLKAALSGNPGINAWEVMVHTARCVDERKLCESKRHMALESFGHPEALSLGSDPADSKKRFARWLGMLQELGPECGRNIQITAMPITAVAIQARTRIQPLST